MSINRLLDSWAACPPAGAVTSTSIRIGRQRSSAGIAIAWTTAATGITEPTLLVVGIISMLLPAILAPTSLKLDYDRTAI